MFMSRFSPLRQKELILDTLLFIVEVTLIVIFFYNNLLLTLLLFSCWLLALKLWHTKQDAYFFIVGALLGPLGELLAVTVGVWTYANPAVLGLPLWLPLAWGLVVVFFNRIVCTVTALLEK